MTESKDTSSTRLEEGAICVLVNPASCGIDHSLSGKPVIIEEYEGYNAYRIQLIPRGPRSWWATPAQLVRIPEAYQSNPKLIRAYLIMSGHEDAAKYVEVPSDED